MANDPQILNVPSTADPGSVAFFSSLKSSIEFLLGHGRNLEVDRALRVSELENFGVDIRAFLNSTLQDPYPLTETSSGATPDAPTNLTITKGVFVHTLTWTNPLDTIVSHIEVWVAEESQRDRKSVV